jgi:membrane protein
LGRLQAGDVINRGLQFAGVLLLCFFPFLLVLESLVGREDASVIIRRFGLTGEAAHAVRQALTSPSPPSTAVSGLSWVFLVLGGLAAAGTLQELYKRVFEVKGRGLRDRPRRVIWLAAALGVSLVGAWTQPWLDRVGGTGLVAIAALPAAMAFWWFSMWLLLAGKLGWRELFPSALATGICWLGMVVVFRLTLSSTIASNYRRYGSAGVVFAIMTLLIAIGVVIILGALLGVAWRARHGHPPGEQPQSLAQQDRAKLSVNAGRTRPMHPYLTCTVGRLRRVLRRLGGVVGGGDLLRGHREAGHRRRRTGVERLTQELGHRVAGVVGQGAVERDVRQGPVAALPGAESQVALEVGDVTLPPRYSVRSAAR